MTGNLGDDPPEWSEAGHITTKRAARRDQEADGRPRRPAADRHRLRHVADGNGHSVPAHALRRQADARPQHDPGDLAGEPGLPRQAARPDRRLHRHRRRAARGDTNKYTAAAATASRRRTSRTTPAVFLECLRRGRAAAASGGTTTATGGRCRASRSRTCMRSVYGHR